MVASALTVTFVPLCFPIEARRTGRNYRLCSSARLGVPLEKLIVSQVKSKDS